VHVYPWSFYSEPINRAMNLIPSPRNITTRKELLSWDTLALREQSGVPGIPTEGYRLTISEGGIVLEASSAAGLFYGHQTLGQLKRLHRDQVPCLHIEDAPELPERGYMLDISRCRVPHMHTLKRLVDLLARFKINQLQLYMEHTFAYPDHPVVWRDSSPLTADDIKELDTYCAERFIELVPNQNSLGHFERWLKHPEYQPYAECPDGFIHPVSGVRKPCGSTLAPSAASADLVEGLYAALLPHFRSRKFNIGCDEPWELGQGIRAEGGLAGNPEDLFFNWLRDRCASVTDAGRTPYFWADVALNYPDRLKELPPGGCAVLWGYEPDHPLDAECGKLRHAGADFIISPGDGSWLSFTGRLDKALPNVRNAATAAAKWGARGILMTHWGDQGHAQPWPTMLPGILLAGAAAWNPRNCTVDVPAGLDAFVFDCVDSGLGQVLRDIGFLDARLKTDRPNRSLLYALVRHSPLPADTMESAGIDAGKLETEINRLETKLTTVSPACPDADWLMDEMGFITCLLRQAHRKLVSPAAPADAGLLRQAISVWERRFRAGGLPEMLGGFR
jgi:hypothetical protein